MPRRKNSIAKKPNYLLEINENKSFLAYNKHAKDNILFIGTCRMSPLLFYFSQLSDKFNIFSLYVPFWTEEQRNKFPTEVFQWILKNTKIIVCEKVSNFDILNTDKESTNNIFNTFEIENIEIINIPSLILNTYLYEIVNYLNFPKDQHKVEFEKSLNRLHRSCISKDFSKLYEFLTEYFQEIRMFYIFNHPSKILSMLTFRLLVEKLGYKIHDRFFHNLKNFDFLEGHGSPITRQDIDMYKFKFMTYIFDNDICNQKIPPYKIPRKELEIPDKFLDIVTHI